MPRPKFFPGARSGMSVLRVSVGWCPRPCCRGKRRPRDQVNSFADRADEILTVHKIRSKILPVLVDRVERVMASDNSHGSNFHDELVTIQTDLSHIQDALNKFVSYERYFNHQIKVLMRFSLADMLKDIQEFDKAYDIEDYSGEADDEIIYRRIAGRLSGISKIMSMLKGDLNVNSDTITRPDIAQTQAAVPHQLPPIPNDVQIAYSNDDQTSRYHRMNTQRWVAPSFRFDQMILHSLDFQKILGKYKSPYIKSELSLACLSVFPEGFVIKRRALINWWIGEGFVDTDSAGDITVNQRADMLFEELIEDGFIVPANEKKSPTVQRCRVNPSFRFVFNTLAKEVKFFDVDSAEKLQPDSFSDSRRAWLLKTAHASSQHALRIRDPAQMHTLFNVNESSIDLQRNWLSRAKKVNVLQLGRWQGSDEHHIQVVNSKFLKSLGDLKRLRYLSLQGVSHVQELPSMSNLTNLRILDLRACNNLEALPAGIGSLKKLAYLDMSECYLIHHMTKELAWLPNLQVLKGFVVGETDTEDLCKLSDLVQLKLRKLSIYSARNSFPTTQEQDCLGRLTALHSLTITWIGGVDEMHIRDDATRKLNRITAWQNITLPIVVPSLPPNLEKLDLRCFPSSELPVWLDPDQLRSLKKLYFRGGHLQGFYQRRYHPGKYAVKILRLRFLREMKIDWRELRAMFPNLIYCERVGCPKLAFFPCDAYGVWSSKKS